MPSLKFQILKKDNLGGYCFNFMLIVLCDFKNIQGPEKYFVSDFPSDWLTKRF